MHLIFVSMHLSILFLYLSFYQDYLMDLSSSLENLLVNLEQEMGSAAAMSAADKVSVYTKYKYSLQCVH